MRLGPECKKIGKKGCGAGKSLLYYPVKPARRPGFCGAGGQAFGRNGSGGLEDPDERRERYAEYASTALFRFHFFRAQSSFPIQEALPLTTAMPLFLG